MTLDEKSTAACGTYSFSDVVDEACDKLMSRQIKYSIRRIQELDECLACLEKELDEFLLQKDRELHPATEFPAQEKTPAVIGR